MCGMRELRGVLQVPDILFFVWHPPCDLVGWNTAKEEMAMTHSAKVIGLAFLFLLAVWTGTYTAFHAAGHVFEVTHALAQERVIGVVGQDSCVSPILSVYTFGHMC